LFYSKSLAATTGKQDFASTQASGYALAVPLFSIVSLLDD